MSMEGFFVNADPPMDFAITTSETTLMCTWSPPDETTQNGAIISYNLICNSSNVIVIDLILKANVFEITLDLFSSTTAYVCSIAASNSAGIGPSSTISITTEGIYYYHQLVIVNSLHILYCIFYFLQTQFSLISHSFHWVLNMAL